MREPHHRGRLRLAAVGAAATLALAGCAGQGADTARSGAGVTITHAFGTTKVGSSPKRVVAWGFGSADALLALGIVPVAIPRQEYGGDSAGVLPWIKDALAAKHAAVPVVLPNNGTDVPIEQIASTRPDVILAPYSGLTKEQYDALSRIAPTVAFPDKAWSTPWRDVVSIVAKAVGRESAGERLVADADALVERKAAQHPELKGKTVAAGADDGKQFAVYRPNDPRVEYLRDFGLVDAPSVNELANGNETFYYTVGFESMARLTSDVLVSYAPERATQDTFLGRPAVAAIPQVSGRHVATITGRDLVTAVSPPTILSVGWGVDRVVDALSKAAKG
ncbi:iron-siderophore ABC transporter substrate-binding protein [Tsukamurella sp. 8F]|uniref:iron-siderophore ABC transporter substrate-binding protein n=1 Tax=unclassified Tsukamurella TaxID=2633480 RepID=UPI0023B96646|nr:MULTISPECIES: iron-siderophore ABC transporter substrate-binding protein [unclassified Tsukamurella]MDF0530589.1 iron-siderophore ABC transporter substrate-binding protein [Tsukamurella sp. 8J]MDF0586761.1 iron-siderophore ABC transporter substrate-binding protein [Tsukamurella sp. 8F]